MTALTIPASVVDRLAWSLAHSVWQLALLAAVAFAFDRAMRRRSASARYWVLLGAFGLMAVAPMITFLWLPVDASIDSRAANPNQEIGRLAPAHAAAPAPAIVMLPPIEKSDFTKADGANAMSLRERMAKGWDMASSALQPWSTQIVWAWLAGVAVFSLRPLLSWRTVRRLRVVGVLDSSSIAKQALERMARRMRMRQTVEVLESALVRGPVVLGYLRPLILLPIGSLAQLPSSQLEAILAHELAHVRRHDYLVNLLQALAETAFFYHPAIWWLSRRIRDERENCCDDIAAGAIGDRVGYGRALLAIEELRAATPSLALGAQDGSLLSRIRRLIEREPAKQRFGGGAVVSGLLAIAILVAGVWTATLAEERAAKSKDAAKQTSSLVDREAPSVVSSDEPEKGTLAAPESATVVGTVVSPDDKPVAGVRLIAFQGSQRLKEQFTTDEQGQFRAPKSWRDAEGFLTVVAGDGREQLGWFDFYLHGHSDEGQKPADGSFRFVLLPMNRTATGRLVDVSNKPIANAPVRVEMLQHRINLSSTHWNDRSVKGAPLLPPSVTDAEGNFAIKLPANTSAWLRAAHPDWREQRIHVDAAQTELTATTLTPAAKVAGWVTDSRTRKPMAGIGVAAQAIEPDIKNGGWGEARTDAEGRYVIGGLPSGQFNIFVLEQSDKRLTASAAANVALEAGQTRIANFSLAIGKRLAGQVLDAVSGQPVAQCTVGYTGPARPRPGAAVLMTTTNDNGHFEFFVPAGPSHLYIAETRESVVDSSRDVEVPVGGDPELVTLKAGPKSEGGIKIFLNTKQIQQSDGGAKGPEVPVKAAPFKPLKDRARSFDIIVAEHVILWDSEIATWEQVVDFLRKIRKARNSPFHANFYFTNGAHKAGRWSRYKGAVMEIYRELFEPAGVSFGSISPRASQRYDAVNIPVDLIPKPKNLRRGIVVNAFDGEPVHYALVVALPEDAMMPVMLERRGVALRDPLDEVWTRTDREGRFEIEAPDSGYRLAIWDRSGFALMSVPPASQTPTIALGRLGHLELQSVAGAKQTINVNVRPAGMPNTSAGFALYALTVEEVGVGISLPPGEVTVSQSFDQGNGSSISVPIETFSLEAGRTKSLTILPAKPDAK